jgi:SAM-dependent methyltransferase
MTVYENCKIFWENYSKRELDTFSLMNLEPDHKKAQAKFEFETAHVERVVKFDPKQIVVDLGSGPGIWSEFFAKRVKQVYAIEREIEFVRMCRERNREKGIRNVDVLHADLVNYEYNFDIPVDLVFLSGVTIYLEDSQFQTLLAHIHNFLRTGGFIIHRDAYGTDGSRFVIKQQYSERLKCDYSAIYRTREEYDRLFARHGFKKTYDCDMYPIQSTLNKWKETRLRLALYENILKGG